MSDPADGAAKSKVTDPLLMELDKLGNGSQFLWMIFIFTLIPTIFNGMYSMSYIFIAEVPDHWCKLPELNVSWTNEQERNISSASPCTMYNYDYRIFDNKTFEEALEYKDHHELPDEIACPLGISFETAIDRTTFVEEWALVCDKSAARASAHMILSLGKLLGSAVFGTFADKYGRKISYVIGVILLIISGPAGALVPWYWAFMISRLFNGASHAAIQYSAFTTLTEVASEKHRQWMGIAYNIGYASGIVIVAGVAYFIVSWRWLQLAISLPALLLLIPLWIMPESPRWLITQNRRSEAKNLIEKASKRSSVESATLETSLSMQRQDLKDSRSSIRGSQDSDKERLGKNIEGFRVLLCNGELRNRLIITNFNWMTASLSYYALALNLNNFSTNKYISVLVMGLTEIPAYLIPTPILMLMGRRPGCGYLYIIAAICLLSILAISTAEVNAIMTVSLIGRFCASAAYGIAILYSSELFPTVCRNSAVGTNSAMSHVGSIAAPYVAELLGAVLWWGPTTLCGVFTLIAGLLCLILPETRGRPLANTVEEEVRRDRENVSLRNICKCA
nr:organic cation transporter protein [Megalopta genalis]XP_033335439.1 organic cation transporter protein [Megalopta genalis]XP_033335441.1 organic cation transporter protein [Megalopta genalis]XP_033335442.1 organic cation transporter protein [Megalopta genalis]XP_033335443.1 organic cation transporter protein [Megalopta genalis]